MLKLREYIRKHKNWEKTLSGAPYHLNIKRGEGDCDGLIMFCYNQFDSDLSEPMVKEARGIIFDEQDDWRVVCYSFKKFHNYGETNAAEIDWKTARVQEKIDGSLMKVWYWPRKSKWMISTNGSIDAFSTPLMEVGCTFLTAREKKTFGELFMECAEKQKLDFNALRQNSTYSFELVSPYNTVVVEYKESFIYHIGTRNLDTLEEESGGIGIPKPKEYPLHNLDAVIEAAGALNTEENNITAEGFVVVDAKWNRIKIKSPLYLTGHYLKTSQLSFRKAAKIFLDGETEEFLSYFPDKEPAFKVVEETFERMIDLLEKGWEFIETFETYESQKEFAQVATQYKWKGFYFAKRKNPEITAEKFLRQLPGIVDVLKEHYEYKDDNTFWRF